jgi:hypothetical protein
VTPYKNDRKSGTREVATVLVAFWMACFAWVIFAVPPEHAANYERLLDGAAMFTVAPALCALGFHKWLKRNGEKKP